MGRPRPSAPPVHAPHNTIASAMIGPRTHWIVTRVGYPCLNLALDLGTNRTLRLASLGDQGKLRAVVAANIANLEAIIRFNAAHRVPLFRLGSSFIPFASHEAFPYDWRAEHEGELRRAGASAAKAGQRLSIHPGQYTVPGSPDERIRRAGIAELRYAADLLDLLGQGDAPVVLHVGGAYGDKPAAAARFIASLENESGILRHLALENDERIWTAAEVAGIARALGVPMILDALHHRLNPGGISLPRAIELALPTWESRRPKLHISSQDPTKNPGAHAYGIDPADWDELLAALDRAGAAGVDVMIESKGKEQSLRPLGHPAIPRPARAGAA